jgi:hypothetical protein
MSDITILALIAGGVVLLLGGLIVHRRRRSRAPEAAELPTFLYLAGHTPDGADVRPPVRAGTGSSTGAGVQARMPPRLTGAPGAGRMTGEIGWAPPADETVQLLPGRLEPVSGAAGQEIRFVRKPGVSRFTLGRSRGAAFDHVQLRAPSASRMHAYMEFEDGRWSVGSLSQTNAVVVNGAALAPDAVHRLADGDRLELGEAAFIFHQPGLRPEVPDEVA